MGEVSGGKWLVLALVVVAGLTCGKGVAAQSTWSHTYSGTTAGAFYGVAATPDGGYVACGWTKAFGAGGLDGWLARLDCTGAVIWQKTYGGPADEALNRVLPLRDGGFLALGYTYSYGQGDSDAWLLRLDATGAPVWQRTYGGHGYDWIRTILPTQDGGYVFMGETDSFGAGLEDLWVGKLDGEGHLLWQKTYGGVQGDYSGGLALLPDGGLLVAGETDSVTPTGNAWVLRLDASGQILWQNRYAPPGQETYLGGGIVALSGGGSVFVGSSYEGGGGGNAWLVRLDDNGAIVWQKSFGGGETDYVYGMVPTQDGGTLLAGMTYSFGAGGGDMWGVRTDPSGNILWQRTYGQGDWDLADGAVACSDGGFLLAGRLTSGAFSSPWAIKVAQDGSMDGSCTFTAPSSATVFTTSAVATPTAFSAAAGSAVEGTTSVSGISSGAVDTLQCGSVGSCALTCTATVPATAELGTPVAFSATAIPEYCPGLPTFAWTFGDGATSTLASPDHAYASGGSFNWEVTVTAGAQTCTKNGTVTVSGGAVPPVVDSMTKMGNPFRIVVRGSGFQNGIALSIDGTPWSNVVFTNAGLLKIKGGASLKAVVPKGVTKAFRFVNPDGGEKTVNWSW